MSTGLPGGPRVRAARESKSVRISVGATLLLLTACVGSSERQRNDGTYVIPVALDVTRLLSPPPEDEAARARDLAAVRAAEQARTPEQAALVEASVSVDVFLFTSVLGPQFVAERLPRTAQFFARVYRSTIPYLATTKECWSRPRPFVVDPTLTPLEQSLASTRMRSTRASAQHAAATNTARDETAPLQPEAKRDAGSPCTPPAGDASYSYSYPSGHATVGAMMAILLAQMVPERRVDLFARGWEYGDARVISGVHYPSDVEAGRILGTALVSLMQQDARFRADLRVARSELREVLGYP